MRIETERLILREFSLDDWPAVLAYQRDPRYLRFHPASDRTEAEVQAWLEMLVEWQREEPRRRFHLAVVLKDSEPPIGACSIRRKPETETEADIGYDLSPGHWGRGYATEAARALVDIGFGEWGLHRISSWCIADHQASARVLERLGLKLEGRLRENEHFKGRWWDALLYGLLEEQWWANSGKA